MIKKIIGACIAIFGVLGFAGSFMGEENEPGVALFSFVLAAIGVYLIVAKKKEKRSTETSVPAPKETGIKNQDIKTYHVMPVNKSDYYVTSQNDVLTNITKEIDLSEAFNKKKFLIDDEKRVVAYTEKKAAVTFTYDDLVDFEYRENGDQIITGKSLATAVGGLAFGGLGALVGMSGQRKKKQEVSQMQIVINMNSLSTQFLKIDLIHTKTKQGSPIYQMQLNKADEIIHALNYIMRNNSTAKKEQ